MNKVILMGRLTRDPSISYTQANSAQESTCVARYALAVDRRFNRDGERKADFISCVAFGRQQSLQKNICAKEQRLPSQAVSRLEVIPTVMDRKFTPQMSSWKSRSLPKVRHQDRPHSRIRHLHQRMALWKSRTGWKRSCRLADE